MILQDASKKKSPMRWPLAVCLAALALAAVSKRPGAAAETPKAPVIDANFWKTWGDGQAELAAYDLTYPRYGKPRQGLAITIFVSEPFSASARVKADPGKHPASDVLPVMKLNLIEDFQTGIYDYNEQTSSFLALAETSGHSTGALSKVTFSSQEWCGHTWLQTLFDPGRIRLTGHSYFDGEAEQQAELQRPPNGVAEEQLMFWARGMARPVLAPGQTVQVPFLPSLQSSRHNHQSPAWGTARLSRPASTKPGVDVFKAELPNGSTRTFYVETAAARRILRWEASDGERAELIASDRLKYWELNKPGGEEALKKLGLRRRAPRTP